MAIAARDSRGLIQMFIELDRRRYSPGYKKKKKLITPRVDFTLNNWIMTIKKKNSLDRRSFLEVEQDVQQRHGVLPSGQPEA